MLPGELSRPTTVVGKRVLIVDDDSDALELLHCVLESRDLEVYDAAKAAEALEWVGSVDFDLIISDIEMPGCNGYELLLSRNVATRMGPGGACDERLGYLSSSRLTACQSRGTSNGLAICMAPARTDRAKSSGPASAVRANAGTFRPRGRACTSQLHLPHCAARRGETESHPPNNQPRARRHARARSPS